MKVRDLLVALSVMIFATSSGQPDKQGGQQSGDKTNGTIETIMARRSIRKYKDTPVSRETLNTILECGINAPNGQNKQSWELRVVDKPEVMEEIKEIMAAANPNMQPEMLKGCFRGAPVMIFIARDPSYKFSAYDVGLLSENIMLSAWSLGVGSICLGMPLFFIEGNVACKPVLDKLAFSDGYELCLCIGLGYADEEPKAKPRDMGKVKFVE